MKIKAKAKALAEIMKTVARAAATRSTTPIMGCVLFEVKDGVLTVSATDMEISVKISCAAPIDEDGSAAIGARLLSSVVRSLPPDKELVLEANDQGAKLTCAGGAYTMRIYAAADFPRLAAFPETGSFTLPVTTLTEGIDKVSVATALDDNRPVLGAVSATVGGGRLRLVATDSYRLALYDAAVEKGPDEEQTALIPAKALREAARLASGVENVEVVLAHNAAHFRAGPIEFSSRVVAGNFPDYKRLLPENFERTYEVSSQALTETLGRVNLFASRQSPPVPVKLAFKKSDGLEGGVLTIAASNKEVGEATEKIGTAVDEEFNAAFNGSYLADGLRSVGLGGDVTFKFNDPQKPAIISRAATEDKEGGGSSTQKPGGASSGSPDDSKAAAKESLYLIMPMRDPDA